MTTDQPSHQIIQIVVTDEATTFPVIYALMSNGRLYWASHRPREKPDWLEIQTPPEKNNP